MLLKRAGRYVFWWLVNFVAAAAGTLILVEGLGFVTTGSLVVL